MKLNKDNFDGNKLAEDGLAIFRIYFKNQHGKRSIALEPKIVPFLSIEKF